MDEDNKDLWYWNEQLKNLKNSEKFLWDYCDESSYKKGIYKEVFDKELGNKLNYICKNNNLLIYTFLVSTLKITLSKYMDKNDIVIGIPWYSNQNAKSNVHINKLLPLVSYIDCEMTYLEYMGSIKAKMLNNYKNQAYLNSKVLVQNGLSNDVMELAPISICMKGIHEDKDINYICESSKNELSFLLDHMKDKSIDIQIVYNSNKITEVTVKALYESYVTALRDILNNYNKKIKDIKILSEKDVNKILYEFNDTKADYPKDKTIHELFEAQVEKTPDNIAIVFEDNKSTYRELNERANSLARVLRNKGVKADSIVGIMVERSLEMIVGIMGILKAGGAYLPIDPSYPKERIEYMLKNSMSGILLSSNDLAETIEFHGEFIDLFNEDLFKGESNNLEKINNSSDLAYVIYTSGTTGNPKGVMIEHKQVNSFIKGIVKETNLNLYSNILCITTICFDIFGLETLVPLTKGLNIVVANREEQIDGDKLGKVITKNNVEVMQSTPSRLKVLLENKSFKESIRDLKLLLIGGEEVDDILVTKLHDSINAKIYNVYGPSETTIWSTVKKLKKNEKVTIGKPISNTKIYILNKNNKLLPVGIAGELCISGDGLSRGYVNRPELTVEKFADNPFESGTKMYKTGDLARWLPDGNIEFLGRIDNQVKIRGFRIELGEIESKLLQHKEIKEAAVTIKENTEKYICAYVISEKSIDDLNLKSYLKEKLPQYMIPAYFVQLDKMPLTANGKLNRKAFPEPNLDATLTECEAPRNKLEETLVKIWSEVLSVEKVGINDNFFDLGGHSLKATILMSKIHKELNREVPLKELFKTPTIKELGKYIESAEENVYSKIDRVDEKEYYEASEAQKRIYMLQSFDKNSVAYNMTGTLEVLGVLDADKVQKVFKKLVERHETLRTSLEAREGNIIQRVHKIEDITFEVEEVIVASEGEVSIKATEFKRPFDLEKAPLFRVELIKLEEERHVLLFDMHHINSDANSISILTEEFWSLYENKELEKLEVQYKDFSAWQNKIYNSNKMKMQEKYWLSKFQGDLPKLELPTDYPRSSTLDFNGDYYDFEIKEELLKRLRGISKKEDVTLFTLIFSAYNIILSKVTNQEDIIVGVPVNCRSHVQLEKVIGPFLNTIAIRNQPKKNITFKEFLKNVNKSVVDGMENQDYQFEMLIDKLNISRELNRTPVFDTIMNFVSTNESSNSNNNLKISPYNIEGKQAKFDITMYVYDLRDTVKISCNYRTGLFKKETIEYLMRGFLNLLELISNDIEKSIKEYNIFNKKEIVLNKNRLTLGGSYNRFKKEEIDQSIIERFEKQVSKYPNNIAIKTNENAITYDLLNKRANKMSQSMLKKIKVVSQLRGNNNPTTVALLCNHDIEMIVAILGALKIGAIFVPLDPTYPRDRLIHMLKNSEATILISDETNITLAETLRDYLGEIIAICKIDGDISNEKYSIKVEAEQIAYIMYTSGSTGEPKGVVQTNENILAFICGYTNELNINQEDKVTLLSSYSHATGMIDIFSALLNGATLCPYDIKSEGNMNNLAKWIEDEEITIYHSVPSVYRYYMNYIKEHQNSRLRLIILGGESLHKSDVELYKENFADDCMFVNLFGSSEVLIATSYLINKETEIEKNIVPIGYLVDNVEGYIINENGEEESVYGVGEIVYSSKYLAKGYWNLKDKTEEVFVNNPVTKAGRVYRSGDIGRILPNGRLEYLGRADYQVKIRGYRVEVSEVESVLDKIEEIEKSVVVAYEKDLGESYLAAYYVVKSGKGLSSDSIKEELKNTLPNYMIPVCFREIEEIPLTPNGKVDRMLLPRIEPKIICKEYLAPTNEIEEKVVEIWKDILNVNNIGINDNFFDLGGHSLNATLFVGRICKELNVEIELKEIFTFSTVREISECIKTKEKAAYERIEKLEVQEWYEASSAQKRIYLMQEFDRESTAYNIPYAIEIIGKLELSKVKESFLKLIKRHESLRTSFKLIDDRIMQKIHVYENISFDLDTVEIVDEKEINSYIKGFVKRFDLGKAPLLRGGIIRVSEEKHIVLFDIHHIVCDGTSMEILITEFGKVYEGKDLERLDIQYKDCSAWQAKKKEREAFKKQEEYWLNEFSGEIPVLNLPTDYTRHKVKSFEGDSISFMLDKDTTYKLRGIAKETGSTIYMVILSSLNILLSKYSGQQDIVIGTPIAGRNHKELENIVGMFVNTLAIRSIVDGEKTFKEYLKSVKEKTLKAYENQDYQFEELVEKIVVDRDPSRNPLFDVMFSFENMDKGEVLINNMTLRPYIKANDSCKFDIFIKAVELDTDIRVTFEYSTNLFKKQTIDKMINHFKNIVNEIVSNECVKLVDISMLNKNELEKIKNDIEDSIHNIEFDF